jgi:hypothetical protein
MLFLAHFENLKSPQREREREREREKEIIISLPQDIKIYFNLKCQALELAL